MRGRIFSSRKDRCFTLVELLAVIAIIAVLAAFLTPVSGKMIKNARSAKDLSNLRQIGQANLAYAADKDGRSVMSYTPSPEGGLAWVWYTELRPYLGKPANRDGVIDVFISPSDPTRGMGSGPTKLAETAWNRRSYSVNARANEYIVGTGRWQGRKMAGLPPSKMIFLGNHKAVEGNTNAVSPDVEASMNLIPTDWHSATGHAQFVFMDGHVEMIKIADLRPGGELVDLWGPPLP